MYEKKKEKVHEFWARTLRNSKLSWIKSISVLGEIIAQIK